MAKTSIRQDAIYFETCMYDDLVIDALVCVRDHVVAPKKESKRDANARDVKRVGAS